MNELCQAIVGLAAFVALFGLVAAIVVSNGRKKDWIDEDEDV